MLLNSCQVEIDFPGRETGLNSAMIVGQWKCEHAKIEQFDNLDGISIITFNSNGGFEIEYTLWAYLIANSPTPGSCAKFSCSGEWIIDKEKDKVFTTATVPEKFHYCRDYNAHYIGERDYHFSHNGENIVFNNIEKPDPITLVIDGNTYIKQ